MILMQLMHFCLIKFINQNWDDQGNVGNCVKSILEIRNLVLQSAGV